MPGGFFFPQSFLYLREESGMRHMKIKEIIKIMEIFTPKNLAGNFDAVFHTPRAFFLPAKLLISLHSFLSPARFFISLIMPTPPRFSYTSARFFITQYGIWRFLPRKIFLPHTLFLYPAAIFPCPNACFFIPRTLLLPARGIFASTRSLPITFFPKT